MGERGPDSALVWSDVVPGTELESFAELKPFALVLRRRHPESSIRPVLQHAFEHVS